MEIVIAIFIGIWMTTIVALAYRKLKRDYQDILEQRGVVDR